MKLPEKFLQQMKEMLGAEYDAWLASYEAPSWSGLRINTAKLLPDQWERISPYGTRRVGWTPNGYYYDAKRRPARDPYYYAGLYYLQEPSAMAPAAVLPVCPGDRVLDLCAAPGGKSTELGARLKGEGLLVANDISSSRARALLKNLELAGIVNICVTSETPEKLAGTFGCFFHGILVDAPCSGEGMFRRDPDLVKSWQEHGPEYYVPLQREILSSAVEMLLPGGYLLYSTCTFSVREDEENVQWLLEENPAMELVPVPLWDGAAGGMDGSPVVRLFPHRVEGEGHFLALFRKREGKEEKGADREAAVMREEGSASGSWKEARQNDIGGCKKAWQPKHIRAGSGQEGRKGGPGQKADRERSIPSQERKLLEASGFSSWEGLIQTPFDYNRMMVKNGQVYVLPEDFSREWNLRYLRTGLLLGELKKGRFEPSQAAAMAMRPEDYKAVFLLGREDERVIRYLKGETVCLEEAEVQRLKERGIQPGSWILVCVDGYSLGWARLAGTNLKNKYNPGWRWQ